LKPFRVQADDRESASPVVELLRQCPDFEVTVTRLKLGDYLVDGRFLFERKTLPDLVTAIISGRLFTQALRLAATSLRPAIILEGTAQDLDESGMSRESIQGALVTVTVFWGIPLLRTRTPAETVRTMLFAAQQRQAYAVGALPRPGYRPRGKRARQLFVLQGLPGIGPELARRLLVRFGGVGAVMNASAEDLQSVSGIGRGTAEKIRWAVDEPDHQYIGSRRPAAVSAVLGARAVETTSAAGNPRGSPVEAPPTRAPNLDISRR
jgi:DNA excision repair protein ERCC-4